MKKILSIALPAAFFLWGCAAHSVQVDPNGVRFFLKMKDAEHVELACSIDRFSPREASRERRGTWVFSVPSNESFTYFYLVDGQVYLPDCPLKESDDFGSANCIYQPNL